MIGGLLNLRISPEPMMFFLRFLKIPVVVVLFASVLSACYMPTRFDAEINITRTGYYDVIFDGYMASVELFRGLEEGEISKEEEEEKVEKIRADLARDPAASEFKYFKKGHFKLHWAKSGDILRAKSVTFLRRNESFLSIQYNRRTGLITVLGANLSKTNAQKLNEMGLAMTGEIRVMTDAKVISSNATKEKKGKGRDKTFIWKINNIFAPMPKLVLSLR
jgi:hypothetical protein